MTSTDIIALVKKQPIGFGCGLLSLTLAGLLYYRSDKIDENQAEFDTKAAAAAKITANVNASKNLSEQVTEIQAATKELESRLVRAGQLAVNLQSFYKLEAETEVKLLDIRQNVPAKNGAGAYVGIPYNVSVQGSYKQVMAFLNRLENGRHFCRISNVVFGKIVGATDSTAMTLTLNLELLGQP